MKRLGSILLILSSLVVLSLTTVGCLKSDSDFKLTLFCKNLTVPACERQTAIFGSDKVFRAWVDTGFEYWAPDKDSSFTKATTAYVYELTGQASYREMFSFGDDISNMWFTQSQIIELCKEYADKFGPLTDTDGLFEPLNGTLIFFLCKEKSQYFVVGVHVMSNRLGVSAYDFRKKDLWVGRGRYLIVSPQVLALPAS